MSRLVTARPTLPVRPSVERDGAGDRPRRGACSGGRCSSYLPRPSEGVAAAGRPDMLPVERGVGAAVAHAVRARARRARTPELAAGQDRRQSVARRASSRPRDVPAATRSRSPLARRITRTPAASTHGAVGAATAPRGAPVCQPRSPCRRSPPAAPISLPALAEPTGTAGGRTSRPAATPRAASERRPGHGGPVAGRLGVHRPVSSRSTRRRPRTSRRVSSAASASPRSPSSRARAPPAPRPPRRAAARRASATARSAACPAVERDPVVDAVHVAVGRREQVAALAVGVVDHRVEHGHPAQGGRSARISRRQVDGLVDVDPQLHHARAERAVPQHRRRHHVQPVASETTYAATSRPASVPSGKSHSGRSPRTGL